MRKLIILCWIFLGFKAASGQQFKILSTGDYSDSSFYHIEKIDVNEFWICGEFGILKKLDTLGNLSTIPFQSNGEHLLKIIGWKDFVFLSGDNGGLYRYNRKDKTWLIKKPKHFENRCFYDFTITEEGEMILCGGTRAIAKGRKKIPNGFIAVCDTGFQNIKKVWSHYRKFCFSVSNQFEGNYQALVYNGLSSRIMESSNGKKWKKKNKIKGLVHDVIAFENSLVICGAKNIHYKEDGMIAVVYPQKSTQIIPASGCIWRLEKFRNQLLGISRSGEMAVFNPLNEKWKSIPLPQAFSIYDAEVFSNQKLILVGHGKKIFMADFK